MMNKDQPVWLITGCSTGFGRELAAILIARGYRIAATARDPAKIADLVRGPRHDLTAGVSAACFYRAGSLHSAPAGEVVSLEAVARTTASAAPASAGLVMTATTTGGRPVRTRSLCCRHDSRRARRRRLPQDP